MTRQIKLRPEQVTKKRGTLTYTKYALYASRCQACGEVFEMDRQQSAEPLRGGPGILHGTFDKWDVEDAQGNGLGNQFTATVCSFSCAGVILNGAWRDIKEYRPFVKAGANLYRAHVEIVVARKSRAELEREWEKREPDQGPGYTTVRGVMTFGPGFETTPPPAAGVKLIGVCAEALRPGDLVEMPAWAESAPDVTKRPLRKYSGGGTP